MCGFVGVIGVPEVSAVIKTTLHALQHRGQDSAGIGVFDGSNFAIHKEMGFVAAALANFEYDAGGVGVGHVRYATRGGATREEAQPFFCRQPGVVFSHNGNLTNNQDMIDYLKERSVILSSDCDIEPMLYIFCDMLMKTRAKDHSAYDVVYALKETYKVVKGSFSISAILKIDGKPSLICFRDPYGLRPAVWGTLGAGYVCASESVALDMVNAELKGDVAPGEVMIFTEGKEPQSYIVEKRGTRPCIFESIYFARPDSVISGKTIYSIRIDFGKKLGEQFLNKKIDVDVVAPVPDTSIPASLAMAETIKKPYRECFIKNRYSGRTFILPTQTTRESVMRLKLNPIVSEVENKKILLLDDSIVRGTTLKRVVSLLRGKGAKEIHLAIHCPPVINPCFYGIDMSLKEDLIAYKALKSLGLHTKHTLTFEDHAKLEDYIAKQLGADSLTYLTVKGLLEVYGQDRCSACFDGEYPIEVNDKNKIELISNRVDVKSCITPTIN